MNIFLFDSHSLEAHSAAVYSQIKQDCIDIFSKSLVVIGHPSMKEWLQIQLCNTSENHSISGLEFVTWRKAVQLLSGGAFFPSRSEIAAAIWQHIELNPIDECKEFFESEEKSIDFVSHLAALFAEYGEYGLPETATLRWQRVLFEVIFRENSWLRVSEALDLITPQQTDPIYLFGIDALPPAVYRFFLRCPKVRLFRFSPCAMFWEDVCSSAEKKRLLKKASPSQLEALDALLSDTHPLLANWGKAGRKMLALAPEVTAENYEIEESGTLLNGLKVDLLLSNQEHRSLPSDGSLRCIRTGTSRLHEVRVLQDEILALAESGVLFSDIRVYAPDMNIYAPLIEFCFRQIPFRIAGVDIACKSHFYQSLLKLFSCVKGRWEVDTLLSLFEMPTFYRKAGWKGEDVERISEWIRQSGIRWGLDAKHREEETGVASELGCWDTGVNALLDSWIYLQPEKESSIGWSESELFQKFYGTFDSLRKMLGLWKTSLTLIDWADEIERCIETYLVADSIGDQSAEKGTAQLIQILRKAAGQFGSTLFPFSFIETFFFSEIKGEQTSSSLHSVRFASLESGTILPARAIFVIGMDEESFPRSSVHSSLRLGMPIMITQPDMDRHLFLSLIFAAKEKLVFSYGHQSPDDGKLVSPSILVQELLGYLTEFSEETASSIQAMEMPQATSLLSTSTSIAEPENKEIGLQDLSRFLKNPFQYYLKNSLGITLNEETDSAWEEFEFSSLTRHLLLRGYLENETPRDAKFPLGLFGEMAQKEIENETRKFSDSLQEFGINPSSIHSVGEATLAVDEGALHLGSDNAGSVLRRWADILSILVEKKKNKVFFLKTGKIREIADPSASLEAIIDLYRRSKNSPLFLHPDWADTLLRKNQTPAKDDSEDRVLNWALLRSPSYDLAAEKDLWDKTLQTAFSSLIDMYPTRGAKNAEV